MKKLISKCGWSAVVVTVIIIGAGRIAYGQCNNTTPDNATCTVIYNFCSNQILHSCTHVTYDPCMQNCVESSGNYCTTFQLNGRVDTIPASCPGCNPAGTGTATYPLYNVVSDSGSC